MELEEAVKNLNNYIFAIDNFGTIDPKCCNNLYEPAKVILKELKDRERISETKDKQLHLIHKELESVRKRAWEIIDKPLKEILMLNTNKIIIESKEDIKGLLDNYIPKDKIRKLLKRHNIEFAEDTIAMSEQGAFGFMLSIKELLEEG